MNQEFFNMVVSLAGFLGAWVLYVIWDAIRDLKVQNMTMLTELSEVKILVAGQYVPRDTFDKTVQNILNKLDLKADKP
jgi:hypothetical protein